MKGNNLPTISIIIPTRDDDKRLRECLLSLTLQVYPKEKLEIVIVDGANSSRTKKLAHEFQAKWVNNTMKLAEPGIRIGMRKAKGELCMVMAVDNAYEDVYAVQKIATVFRNSQIIAAFPKHASTPNDSLFTKYINTFSDPATHFLYGNATNARTFSLIFPTKIHTSTYDIYDFSARTIQPVIALAQGFTLRKAYMSASSDFDDIQPIHELLQSGKLIAYVYSVSLIHHTLSGIKQFVRKQRWAIRNMLQKKNYGINLRRNTLTSWQRIKIYLYPLYGISIIIPCFVALYCYMHTRQAIWLFHPIITFISSVVIVYEYATISLHKNSTFLRK